MVRKMNFWCCVIRYSQICSWYNRSDESDRLGCLFVCEIAMQEFGA